MAQTPNVLPFIESNEREYRDSGIPSTVAIAGHPLHPLIVTFPIAFLIGASGADLGYWLTSDPFWERAALWLIGAGFIAGLLAALTGMLDFLKINRVKKHNASWIHMIGSVTVKLQLLVLAIGMSNQTPLSPPLARGKIRDSFPSPYPRQSLLVE